MAIETVGVVGAGQMGNGIAHVCAVAGYNVLLNDVNRERIDAGIAVIDGNLTRQVNKGALEDKARREALGRIKPAENLDSLARLQSYVARKRNGHKF